MAQSFSEDSNGKAGRGAHQPRRRRTAHSTIGRSSESLEIRQCLTGVCAGPMVPGEMSPPVLLEFDVGAVTALSESSLMRHDDGHDDGPEVMPLPKDWKNPGPLAAARATDRLHPLSALPALSSNPLAGINIYLDFNGHFQEEWSGSRNIQSPAFTLDNDAQTFSDEELAAIAEIFARVAEDYSPFQVNVTTVEPPVIENGNGIRVVIGGRFEDWYKSPAGGVAFVDSFSNNLPNVAYVFSTTLAVNQTIAEATSHEAGHTFGLWHQSQYNSEGRKTQEYYAGNATGAPIMGLSYSSVRSRWWRGTSLSSTTIQDDLEMLTRPELGLQYRVDDHGNDAAQATLLSFVDQRTTVEGIIERMDDADVFRFTVTTAEQYRIDYHAATVGANLDVWLELRKLDGTLITDDMTFHDDDLAIGRTLLPGDYQIIVRSDGTYGSLGQYSLQVSAGHDPSLPPTTPGDIAAQFIASTVATFQWVDALGETSYILHATREVGRKSESFSITIPADSTAYTLSGYGVLDGWQYILEAVNGVGSNQAASVTPAEIPVTEPVNVVVQQFANAALAVTWDAVPGAWAYLVSVQRTDVPDAPVTTTFLDGSRTASVVENLLSGRAYQVIVTARNSLGDAHSAAVTVALESADVAPIPSVILVHGTAPTTFSVSLTWTAVAQATRYQIQQRQGKQWITVGLVDSPATSAIVFPDGTKPKLQFRIVATDGHATSVSKPWKIKRPIPMWRGN